MEKFKNRFPDYNVLDKRNTPSWDGQTRKVVEDRIENVPKRRFFDQRQWRLLEAVCSRIVPQPDRKDHPVPIAPFIDMKLYDDNEDGTRYEGLPAMRDAWRLGLEGIEDEARLRYGVGFCGQPPENQDVVLGSIQKGNVKSDIWQSISPSRFFKSRLLHDIVAVYYAHPLAWNEIGFGGPASPRGYARLDMNRRDPWEAVEEK